MPTSIKLPARSIRRRVRSLYVEPAGETNAGRAAAEFRALGDEESAKLLDRISTQPQALWLGEPNWTTDPAGDVDRAITVAGSKLRVLCIYSIPARDGDAYSSGGSKDAWAYGAFVAAIAAGIKGRKCIVILEPDAICHIPHLSVEAFAERLRMMASAVDVLTAAGAKVYVDAGDSDWVEASVVADRLKMAGVAKAAGFATNVAHTEWEDDEQAYADEIRDALGYGARYIIDTSRSGRGPGDATGERRWCNPRGRGLGTPPTLTTGVDGCDALLWVKRCGESDGTCGGGPKAGAFWTEYAMELCRNAV